MIIGNNFNSKAKQLLQKVFESSDGEVGKRINVQLICEELVFDKTEVKNLIEYLDSKDYLKIETFGGPFLYGDVSLTKKGLYRAQK